MAMELITRLKNRIEQLIEQADHHKKQCEALKMQLEKSEEEKNELNQMCEELMQEQDSSSKDYKELQENLQSLLNSLDAMDEENEQESPAENNFLTQQSHDSQNEQYNLEKQDAAPVTVDANLFINR